jgi:hypothetical protein
MVLRESGLLLVAGVLVGLGLAALATRSARLARRTHGRSPGLRPEVQSKSVPKSQSPRVP